MSKIWQLVKQKWNAFIEEYKVRQYRLKTQFGSDEYVEQFSSDKGLAFGKTNKAYAFHEADKAELQELIGGRWCRVHIMPPENLEEMFLEDV